MARLPLVPFLSLCPAAPVRMCHPHVLAAEEKQPLCSITLPRCMPRFSKLVGAPAGLLSACSLAAVIPPSSALRRSHASRCKCPQRVGTPHTLRLRTHCCIRNSTSAAMRLRLLALLRRDALVSCSTRLDCTSSHAASQCSSSRRCNSSCPCCHRSCRRHTAAARIALAAAVGCAAPLHCRHSATFRTAAGACRRAVAILTRRSRASERCG